MSAARPDSRSAALEALRRRVALLERRGPVAGPALAEVAACWLTGLEALDRALPATGLAPDGLHEAAGAGEGDGPAAAAFLAALLARLRRHDGRRAVLVCERRGAEGGRLYGPGWRDLGLDPAELLLLSARRDRDVAWALEEGLRSAALAAVLGEVEGLDFTASRRLSLAARESRTPALLLRRDGLAPPSAAETRWRVAALPAAPDPFDDKAPGRPRWRLHLHRCHSGRPASCEAEWNPETTHFHPAPPPRTAHCLDAAQPARLSQARA